MLRISRQGARRIAIRAQLLDADRAPDLRAVVERLTFLQLDPTAVIAPSADLIAWSRLGAAHGPADLQRATETDRVLFEHASQPSPKEPGIAMLRPMADLGLFQAAMAAWEPRWAQMREWVEANESFRRDVLARLEESGPLLSRDIPDTSAVSWRSSGWTNDRNVTRMLDVLAARGEAAVFGRQGKQRIWDLAERVYPAEVEAVPVEEARRILAQRRVRSLGITRPVMAEDAGVPVEVEGTSGEWRVDPDATADGFEGRTAILSPFDRLVHDRVRAQELFDFEYVLEMYKPKDARRWGYFALPVLHHDRLVGKVDAAADRKAGALRVQAIHYDVQPDRALEAAIAGELSELAAWLQLTDVVREG